ncbi:hypothetical protein Tco_1091393 [Tanacetum coccineum]|uniref:Uncharacterized protein n=1 Tax=Tanacetum coccineum TaxID=301880 RepID=A0ABQ5I733_9ASTR
MPMEKKLIQVLKSQPRQCDDLLTNAFDGPNFAVLVYHIEDVKSPTYVMMEYKPKRWLVDVINFNTILLLVCTLFLLDSLDSAGRLMGILLLVDSYSSDKRVCVPACFTITSIYAAELFDIAGWSLPIVSWFLLVVSNHAGGTMYLLPE